MWSKYTVKLMKNDSVVASGLEVFRMWLSRSVPEIVPYSESDEHKQQAQFVRQCMLDMDHTFEDFFSDILTYIEHGYAPIEMVFRKRLIESGSKYNDGLVGWKKLPLRSQETLYKWEFSDDGRNVVGMQQDINNTNTDRYNNLLARNPTGIISIPIEKLMMFRYNPVKGNPEGRSPLMSAYTAFKYRTEIEYAEAVGIQRNMNGVPTYYLPPDYLSEDAEDSKKAVANEVKRQIRSYQNNEQAGFVIPNVYDEHSKQRLFSLEPLEIKGNNQYNTSEIIKRYDLKILTTLLADVLALGQEGGGSFALSENKTALMQMNLEARLKEIASVIRNTLFKLTFQLNGWDAKYLPEIKFTFPADVEIDQFGKLAQRLGSIEFMPRDGKVVAWVMQQAGYPDFQRFEDMGTEELGKLFPSFESGAGEALGSGKTQQGGANSAKNSDNAA